MVRIGFIGTGSMGGLLIEAFLQSGALRPEQITASNRTAAKADKLAADYPGLRVARSNIEVVENSEIVFLCVKPAEFKRVLDEIRKATLPSHIVVSITSPVLIRQLEEKLPCKIVKMIPSVTNRVRSGAALCMYGSRLSDADRDAVEQLLSFISTPVRIAEKYTRVCSDISSCGPAFFAFFLQKLIDAAVQETGLPRDLAARLAGEMALGTARLLTDGGFSCEEVQKRVAVPGGITAEGLNLLNIELDGVFNRLLRVAHAKYREDLLKIEEQFEGQAIDRSG